MKNLIAIALFACTTLAHATSLAPNITKIIDGDVALMGGEGRITDVRPICGGNPGEISCMAIGSRITVSIPLGGCLNRLGGYHHSFQVKNGKGVLTFASTIISNKASFVARCVRMPTAEVVIHTSFEGQVEIKNLPFTSR